MFDDLTECLICGRMYRKLGRKDICPDCRDKEEEMFRIVKEYLYDYPDASMEEVEEQTNVSEKLIDIWLKEGRLEQGGMARSYPCKICGRAIHIGSVCKRCQEDLGVMEDDVRNSRDNKDEKDRQTYISGKLK